jgi:hypothetical protein
VTKEEVDDAVKEIESQFPTKEIYLQQIQASGITEAELRTSIEENMKRGKALDEVVGVVSTDEKELRDFYGMMKEYAFRKPEGFKMDVAHFATGESAEAARKELESGKKWDDVITASSGDVVDYSTTGERMFIPAEQLTGDVEFIKELSMDIPSKVVTFTSDDHMIVVKRSKEEAGTAPFDEVSADIEQMLVSQKRTSLQSQFMQELRARASVEILDQELFKTLSPDASGDVTETSGDAASPVPDANAVSADAPEASVTSADGD